MGQFLLSGDVGATKTVLALWKREGEDLGLITEQTLLDRDHERLEDLIRTFLDRLTELPPLEGACLGVAGPVLEGRVHMVNTGWTFTTASVGEVLGTREVRFLNDVQAAALGMLRLDREQIEVLNPGAEDARGGNLAVVAPGTGLGEGILFQDGDRYHPIPTEGGHTDFAPRNEREMDLLRYLQDRCDGHVSYERILTGDGLHNLYSFLRDTGFAEEPSWLAERLSAGDRNAAIAEAGLEGGHPLATEALALFCEILGAEAGNLALKCLATGGVLIGGGIPPKILPALREAHFMRGFVDKGRFSSWMADLPVKVSLDPRAPVIGAAYHALGSLT